MERNPAMTEKQMTSMGPRRRLGDVLQAQMHRVFTTESDYLYEMGFMDREERILLSSLVGQALDTITRGMPEDLANRYLDYPYMEMEAKPNLLSQLIKSIRGVFQKEDIPADTSTAFFKDESGQWWMIGIYSNRFEDRHGDIIPQTAHDEYAAWLKSSDFKPVITVLHQPRLPKEFWLMMWQAYQDDIPTLNEIVRTVYADYALGEVVRIVPLNGFMSVVAKIFPHRQAQAEALSAMKDLGMSHGFIAAKEDDKVIAAYRSFEFTVLPRERAANLWTQPLFSEVKQAMPISKEDRTFLEGIGFPSDVLDKGTEEMFQRLAPILKFKEIADPPPAETPVETPATTPSAEYSDIRAQLIKDLNLEGLQTVLTQMTKQIEDLTALTKTQAAVLATLETQTKSLSQDEDARIASQFQAPVWPALGFSPTQQVNKEEAEVEVVTATTPTEPTNPLEMMLWEPLNGKR